MNKLSGHLVTGTIGELIVQLRFLQFEVQAVATHKDSGNDLLAVRDEVFRAVQVKATRRTDGEIGFDRREFGKFHILALVFLAGEGDRLDVDASMVYLMARPEVRKGCYRQAELEPYRLTRQRIDTLFTGELPAA